MGVSNAKTLEKEAGIAFDLDVAALSLVLVVAADGRAIDAVVVDGDTVLHPDSIGCTRGDESFTVDTLGE